MYKIVQANEGYIFKNLPLGFRGRQISESEVSLVFTGSSRPASNKETN